VGAGARGPGLWVLLPVCWACGPGYRVAGGFSAGVRPGPPGLVSGWGRGVRGVRKTPPSGFFLTVVGSGVPCPRLRVLACSPGAGSAGGARGVGVLCPCRPLWWCVVWGLGVVASCLPAFISGLFSVSLLSWGSLVVCSVQGPGVVLGGVGVCCVLLAGGLLGIRFPSLPGIPAWVPACGSGAWWLHVCWYCVLPGGLCVPWGRGAPAPRGAG
jgi:hypothetical protein